MKTIVAHQGLSRSEVQERVASGQINRVKRTDQAEYLDIFLRNTLTLFNALVLPAAIALLALGDYRAGVAVSGMAIIITVLGLIQEIRAKWQLDRLTLLSESRIRVIRESQQEEIPSGEVVRGDFVCVATGDPIVADGTVIESEYLEIDEALLTGESDPVSRKEGEEILSGSFCVTGQGVYRADRVGKEAFIHKTANEARGYKYTASPLQKNIDWVIRILTTLAVLLSFFYVARYFVLGNIEDRELLRQIAATITSMVPQGLVLMTTIALLLGAIHMSHKGAVVNRLAAVEAMASIDTLCMDKTGTLTTNQLRLDRIECLTSELTEEEVQMRLRLFASCSLDQNSKSLQAMIAALGQSDGERIDQLPFKAQNRYSAVSCRLKGVEYRLVLGADEALQPFLTTSASGEDSSSASATGLRVLLFADVVAGMRDRFQKSLEGFTLRPLARIYLSDELRPEAATVLRHLAAQDITFKILSGDNPATVQATVSRLAEKIDEPTLRLLSDGEVISGKDLEDVSDPDRIYETRTIFGRVSPWQKVQIVRGLMQHGHQVAMLGDGVNDVLPIKNASLGMAMGEGSRASKTVAGVVLQNNDFGLMPELLEEGRKIIRNLRRAAKLFLNKNVYTLVMIIGALGIFNLPFPFSPQQVTLFNLLTIGLPALLITVDRTPAERTRGAFLIEVGWFVGVTGLLTGLAALVLMLIGRSLWGEDEKLLRTLVVSLIVLMGYGTFWRGLTDNEGAGITRRSFLFRLPFLLMPLYLATMYLPGVTIGDKAIPPLSAFFELEPLTFIQWAGVIGFAAVTTGLLLLCDWFLKPQELLGVGNLKSTIKGK